jgi:hypothetical protein
MAERGRPLRFLIREQLRADKRAGKTVRQIADAHNLSKTTVCKWTKQIGTR